MAAADSQAKARESLEERMADAVDAVRCGRMKRQQFDRVVHANFEEKSIQLHQVRFANVKQHKQNFLRHPERKEFFCDLAINKEFDPPTGTRIEAQFSRIKAVMMTRGSIVDMKCAPKDKQTDEIFVARRNHTVSGIQEAQRREGWSDEETAARFRDFDYPMTVLRPEIMDFEEVYRLYIDLDNDDQKCMQLQTYQLPQKVAECKMWHAQAKARAEKKGEKFTTSLADYVETGTGQSLTDEQIEMLASWHKKGIFATDGFGYVAARTHIMEQGSSPVYSFLHNTLATQVAAAINPSFSVGTTMTLRFSKDVKWTAPPKTYQQLCKYLNSAEPTQGNQDLVVNAVVANIKYSKLMGKVSLSEEETVELEALKGKLVPNIANAKKEFWPEDVCKIPDELFQQREEAADHILRHARFAATRIEDGVKLELAKGKFEIKPAHKPRSALDACKGRVCLAQIGEGVNAEVRRVVVEKNGANPPGSFQDYMAKNLEWNKLDKVIDAHRGMLMEACRERAASSSNEDGSATGTDEDAAAGGEAGNVELVLEEELHQELYVTIDGTDVHEREFKRYVGKDVNKKKKLVAALFNRKCRPLFSQVNLYPKKGNKAHLVLSLAVKPDSSFYQSSTVEALEWTDDQDVVGGEDGVFETPTVEMLKNTECNILQATGTYSGLNSVKVYFNSTHTDNDKQEEVHFRLYELGGTVGEGPPDVDEIKKAIKALAVVESEDGKAAKKQKGKAAAGSSGALSFAKNDKTSTDKFVILLPFVQVPEAESSDDEDESDGDDKKLEDKSKGVKKETKKKLDSLWG